ncbi:MAG: aminopeptidase [Candidatus Improbicoccus devescovinae]|nr:MAG: aminopeptidase [Candidatus Improbicoccus devescovinae]
MNMLKNSSKSNLELDDISCLLRRNKSFFSNPDKIREIKKNVFDFSEDYKLFLNSAKTEREVVKFTRNLAISKGFEEFNNNKNYTAGDKVFVENRNKNIILAVVGTQGLKLGANIIVSHIDCPRLDLKQNPLYEIDQLACMKTQYYGGIRKYQWLSIPLAIHGRVSLKNGEHIDIVAGEFNDDYCFCITDLLPHLASEQMKKSISNVFIGENLKVIVGSEGLIDSENNLDNKHDKHAIKLKVLDILHKKYGITEVDFAFSEFEIVPSFQARDIGFDKALIGAYGHDDRCCSYAGLQAILDKNAPKSTSILAFVDKEEVGSDGNTGAKSVFLRNFIADFAELENLKTRNVISKSRCISADVDGAFDPTFPEHFDNQNCSWVNRGVALTKYTGSRGKSGASDASEEFLSYIRNILESNNITWQSAALGKVDVGGGGTVAKYLANLGMDVVDMGIPVLSMHSPFEIISKYDLYETFSFFKCFYAG